MYLKTCYCKGMIKGSSTLRIWKPLTLQLKKMRKKLLIKMNFILNRKISKIKNVKLETLNLFYTHQHAMYAKFFRINK